MDEITPEIQKKTHREMLFLVGIFLIVCFPVAAIIAFLDLNYGRNIERDVLIVFPVAILLSIFCLYHMNKKGLLHPKIKEGLKILFRGTKY